MKYYLYISDAKVDMLLPQISDAHKKKVATEFGFDVKIFSAKRKVEEQQGDDRIARLEAVLSFIRQFGNLGTIDKPDEYIEDSMPMYSMILDEGTMARVIYFTGVQDKTFVGLGGSTNHLIGALPATNPVSASWALSIRSAIDGELYDEKYSGSDHGVKRIIDYLRDTKYPAENLRFMAKGLFVEKEHISKDPRERVIVATPLYVAKDD